MKLVHEVNLDVDGKKLSISIRDLKKSEVKSLEKRHEALSDKVKELKKIEKDSKRLESKLKRLENKEASLTGKELAELFNEQEKLIEQIEKLEDKAEKIDLSDIGDKVENIYKDRIDIACYGEGKDDVIQLGADYGYKRIWEAITEAAIEAEKKL